ncbi:hypothetical protein M6B38_243060 [Iris pallida]|uniref:Uncharacterized protein n=1 Tax=Iris pallida TaxID=29817 RepID=A0AAX6DK77_IRIPA|nr:hypothetical protein M6B38_243060 [Iris pallida]
MVNYLRRLGGADLSGDHLFERSLLY